MRINPTNSPSTGATAGGSTGGRQTLGPVAVFAANAGVPSHGGYEGPNDEWDRIWKVNVRERSPMEEPGTQRGISRWTMMMAGLGWGGGF